MTSVPRLLLDEHPLIVLPSLACQFGLNEAIVLQQLHYWLLKHEHVFEGVSWVYNSYPQWRKQFPFWSIPTIQRIISGLEAKGILLVGHYNTLKLDRTKWYTIDYEKVDGVNDASYQLDTTIISTWDYPRASRLPDSSEFQPEITTEKEYSPKVLQLSKTKQTHEAAKAVLAHLCLLTGRKYKSLGLIPHTLTSGATEAECFLVLDWLDTERRQTEPEWVKNYLDHTTPFRPTNFDKYLARAKEWEGHRHEPQERKIERLPL